MALDLDRLRRIFREELGEHRATLQAGLLELERDPSALPALLPELFRAAHSLKGGAQVVQLRTLAMCCHRLEEHLAALREGTAELSPQLLASMLSEVDALGEVDAQPDDGAAGRSEPSAPGDDLIAPRSARPPAPDPRPSVRIAADRLDDLLDQAGEILLARDRLDEHARDSQSLVASATVLDRRWRRLRPQLSPELAPRPAAAFAATDAAWSVTNQEVEGIRVGAAQTARALHEAASGLEHTARALRLQPFRGACEGLDRAVRDLTHPSRGGATRADLVIEDGGVELDGEAVAGLREPLLHLVRNAIAHGIEPAERRRGAGKPERGTVTIRAQLLGDQVEICIADDGAGLDTTALIDRAQQRGVEVEDDASAPDQLAWLPGLSTAAVSDEVSGRGVGLDAVRDRVEQLGGTVQLASVAGEGCTVTLSLPSTLATLHAVLVEVAGQVLAMPSAAVERVVRVAAADIQHSSATPHVMIDGQPARVVSLTAFLGQELQPELREPQHALLVTDIHGAAVLLVDRVLDTRRVTRRQLHPRLAGAPGLIGVSLLPSGEAVFVVNPVACIRAAGDGAFEVAEDEDAAGRPARVLLVDDAATTRALEQHILERAGYEVRTAVDGAEAWRLLAEHGADLVVTDVEMPTMDGFALCRTIREDARFADLPVIVVTSRASDEDRLRGIEAGADAYLVKGEFDQETFLESIARLL